MKQRESGLWAFIAKQSSHFYAAPRGKKPNHLLMRAWYPLRFRKKVVLADLAAEAQAPMVIADKTELSTTV
jgi:hypothetical protein